MGNVQQHVAHDVYASHRPIFADEADRIMESLRPLSVPQLAATLGIGPKSAASLHKMVYEFPDKSRGMKAALAFNGVVFKALDMPALPPEGIALAGSRLRIISSLYGWLAPGDIIKPYRMEFKAPVAPDATPLNRFWKRQVTVALVNMIKETGDNEILDLLPADASRCIDWKLVRAFASVYVANFKQQVGMTLKTPNSTRLKELRGQLLRHILTCGIMSATNLRSIESEHFIYDSDSPYPGHLLFITA